MKILILLLLLINTACADGISLVNPTTIGINKTNNKTVAQAEKEMNDHAKNMIYLQQQADESLANKQAESAAIDEILSNFQAVGIDLIDPRQ